MKVDRYLIFFTLCVGLSWHSTQAYSKVFARNIPPQVIEKLDSIFPGMKQVQWTKTHRKYRADFLYKGRNISITLDREGELFRGAEEIAYESLPLVISEKIIKSYNLYKVLIITKRFKKRSVQYEIEVIKGEFHYVLNYNVKGFLIHQYEVIKSDLNNIPSH